MSVRKERRDAVEHHRMIMQNAKALFLKHGVDGVSMHQIAKSAGVGQATLYRRYAHKGELCLDLAVESCRHKYDKIDQYLKEHQSLPVRVRLESVLDHLLDFVDEQSQLLGAIQKPKCEEGRAFFYRSPFYQSIHGLVCNLFQEALVKENHKNMNPVFMADAVLAALAPDLYLFQRRERGYTLGEIKSSLVSLYLDPLFS